MRPGSEPPLFVGLMSGTSADGIDVALVQFHGDGPGGRPDLVAARTFPWPDDLRRQLVEWGQHDAPVRLDAVAGLDVRIGQQFAAAANALLAEAPARRGRVAAIGSHGQTLRHRPCGDAPFSLQLGDANVIAERCRLPVVADFRRRDVAAGGQGAPLVPAFHAAVLHDPGEDRAVLNLGGVANLTLLPASGAVRGFDTGPANGLMDAWCLRHTGRAFDEGGMLAAGGSCDPALLDRLLSEPWFALPPPKSTGRDQFHLPWLEARLSGRETAADVQATLLALSARSIALALRATQPRTARVLACGGGVRNQVLMRALAAALPDMHVETTAAHGLDPDFVEAIAFAWLAREHLAGRPGNLPTVTGATGPRVLGSLFPG